MNIPYMIKQNMAEFLHRIPFITNFVEHPEQVCMTYYSHLKFSLHMTKLHAYGTAVSFIHAIFPWMYTSEVSVLNQHIRALLNENGCREDSFEMVKPKDE